MKNTHYLRFTLMSMLLIAVTVFPVFAADNPWDMKLPFENATIYYEVTGTETGNETLYIKEFGDIKAHYHQ